jgi:hypothetical protein
MSSTAGDNTETATSATPPTPTRCLTAQMARAGLALAAILLLQGCGNWLGTDWGDNEYEHSHRDSSDR